MPVSGEHFCTTSPCPVCRPFLCRPVSVGVPVEDAGPDDPVPVGLKEFVNDVRKRLEPFGVEVRFEVDGTFVKMFAGLKYCGTVVRAKDVITHDLLQYRSWPGASTANNLMIALMKRIGEGVRLPKGETVADMSTPVKIPAVPAGSRVGGVRSEWSGGFRGHGSSMNSMGAIRYVPIGRLSAVCEGHGCIAAVSYVCEEWAKDAGWTWIANKKDSDQLGKTYCPNCSSRALDATKSQEDDCQPHIVNG